MSTAFDPLSRTSAPLDPVERGILWPVVYASIFRAPVRSSRLQGLVVGVRASEAEVRRALARPALRELLVEDEGLVWLRRPDLPGLRAAFARRETSTRELLERHHRILSFVRGLPGVRLAALSGGCAHEAAEDEDIDVFAVTEANALWRTLLTATLVAKARGWRRVLCLNYLVDATAQTLPTHDFYAAFELISLRPLRGHEAFLDLLAANPWVDEIFPNFPRSGVQGQNPANRTGASARGRLLEITARMIHRPYLRHRLPASTGVELSDHVVRLHATDHRARIRNLFHDALHNLGMEAPTWI